jgi:hypothetical protein
LVKNRELGAPADVACELLDTEQAAVARERREGLELTGRADADLGVRDRISAVLIACQSGDATGRRPYGRRS